MIQSPSQGTDGLYSNPNQASVQRIVDPRSINKNKVVYQVYFEPYTNAAEASALKLKFTEGTKYNVHEIIPSATGKLDAQRIA